MVMVMVMFNSGNSANLSFLLSAFCSPPLVCYIWRCGVPLLSIIINIQYYLPYYTMAAAINYVCMYLCTANANAKQNAKHTCDWLAYYIHVLYVYVYVYDT